MKDCKDCIYSNKDTDEHPCSQCLDSYLYLPKFKQKDNNKTKEEK